MAARSGFSGGDFHTTYAPPRNQADILYCPEASEEMTTISYDLDLSRLHYT